MSLFSKTLHAGININDRSIELIILNDVDHPKRIEHAARVTLASGTIERGIIKEPQRLVRALASVKAQAGIKEKTGIRATISLSEDLVYPFTVTFDPTTPQEKKRFLIEEEAKNRIPIPRNELILFRIPGEPHPHITFLYAIRKNVALAYERALAEVGITVDHIEPESIAISRFLLPDVHRQQSTTIIDIGTNITHCITLFEGYPILSQVIPHGADTLRATIAKKTKKASQDHTKKINSIFGPFADLLKEKILHADTFSSMYRSLKRDNKIVLVGGGSLLPHIAESCQEKIKRPVSTGTLTRVMEIPTALKRELALYAQAIGSALRETSKIAGFSLEIVEQEHAEKKKLLSLTQFKSRTTLLIIFFVLLIVLLIALVLRQQRQNPSNNNPALSNSSQQTENQDSMTGESIDVFTVNISPSSTLLSYSVLTETTTDEQKITTTGEETIAGQITGVVVFHNDTSAEKPLVASTRILSPDGFIFRTDDAIVIPANGTIEANVTSDEENLETDIAENTRFSVPGLSASNQQVIYAINSEKLSANSGVKILSDEDVATALDLAKEALQDELEAAFKQREDVSTLVSFIPEQTKFTTTSDPDVGSEAAEATVTITATGTALSFPLAELQNLAYGQIGVEATIKTLSVTVSSFDAQTKTGSIGITVQYVR